MTNHTEQLLRDVFAEQADRAPSGAPILAVLDRPPSRSRRPMLIVAGAAGVAVIAAGVPIALNTGGSSDNGPPGATSDPPTSVLVQAPPNAQNQKLKYTAGWLPEGVTERARSSRFDAVNQSRVWAKEPVQGLVPDVGLATSWVQLTLGDFDAPAGEKVDINGHEGVLFNSGPTWTDLAWSPAEREILVLRVLQVPNAKEAAVRIARSVRADGASEVTAGLSFSPELPPEVPLRSAAVYGDGITEISASAGERTETVRVRLTRSTPGGTVGGIPIGVGSRQGLYVASQPSGDDSGYTDAYLSVKLDEKTWLEMSVTPAMDAGKNTSAIRLSKDQMLMILDRVVAIPGQDYSWMGK
jgi:hypothetical protein